MQATEAQACALSRQQNLASPDLARLLWAFAELRHEANAAVRIPSLLLSMRLFVATVCPVPSQYRQASISAVMPATLALVTGTSPLCCLAGQHGHFHKHRAERPFLQTMTAMSEATVGMARKHDSQSFHMALKALARAPRAHAPGTTSALVKQAQVGTLQYMKIRSVTCV